MSSITGAGEMELSELGSDGRMTGGSGAASAATTRVTATGTDGPVTEPPLIHWHCTERRKVEPIGAYTPSCGKLADAAVATIAAFDVPTSCAVAAPWAAAEALHVIAKPRDATSIPSCRTAREGAGERATKVDALPEEALGSTWLGAVILSVIVAMRIAGESAVKVAPEIHVHCTEIVKLSPNAPYAPRPDSVAVAAVADEEVASVPTSCAALDEAAHETAKPSEDTSTPSCDIVMTGAGEMGTIEAPPVEALASTLAGAETFRLSDEMRTGADCAVKVAPLIQEHWTCRLNAAPKPADAPSCEKVATPVGFVDAEAVPTS